MGVVSALRRRTRVGNGDWSVDSGGGVGFSGNQAQDFEAGVEVRRLRACDDGFVFSISRVMGFSGEEGVEGFLVDA